MKHALETIQEYQDRVHIIQDKLAKEESKVGLLVSENQDLRNDIEHHQSEIKNLNHSVAKLPQLDFYKHKLFQKETQID